MSSYEDINLYHFAKSHFILSRDELDTIKILLFYYSWLAIALLTQDVTCQITYKVAYLTKLMKIKKKIYNLN